MAIPLYQAATVPRILVSISPVATADPWVRPAETAVSVPEAMTVVPWAVVVVPRLHLAQLPLQNLPAVQESLRLKLSLRARVCHPLPILRLRSIPPFTPQRPPLPSPPVPMKARTVTRILVVPAWACRAMAGGGRLVTWAAAVLPLVCLPRKPNPAVCKLPAQQLKTAAVAPGV